MIDCTGCKAPCCRHVGDVPLMKQNDRGDGVCRFLDDDSRCTIYSSRPLVCNTDKLFDVLFSGSMGREEFDAMNAKACEVLRNGDGS